MMFKKQLTLLASALLLAGSVFAGQDTTCPNLSDIQAEGLSMAEQTGPDSYFSYNFSLYNTDDSWGFVIAPIQADSLEAALESSNELLSSMTAPGVPQIYMGELICNYDTGNQNIMAAALKADHLMAPSKLRQYIKQAH